MATAIVSLAVMVGLLALAGLPWRCWQLYSGSLRATVPSHAVAQATFSVLALVIFLPNLLAWIYALFSISRDYAIASAPGAASALAVGLLGCTYMLLEGFLLTARRAPPRAHHPGNDLANSAAKRE